VPCHAAVGSPYPLKTLFSVQYAPRRRGTAGEALLPRASSSHKKDRRHEFSNVSHRRLRVHPTHSYLSIHSSTHTHARTRQRHACPPPKQRVTDCKKLLQSHSSRDPNNYPEGGSPRPSPRIPRGNDRGPHSILIHTVHSFEVERNGRNTHVHPPLRAARKGCMHVKIPIYS